MARPAKTGLSYYPLDCDFLSDEKVIAVKANCGAKGVAVIITLLCTIYRQGYYAQWNEMTSLKIANDLPGVTADAVNKVVELLVKYDFFDKGLYSTERILTSAAIQRRYFSITRRRRTDTGLPHLLINADNNSVIADNNSVIADNNATNKTKQNKTKENKTLESVIQGERPAAATLPPPEIDFEKVVALRELPQVKKLFPSVADCEAFYAYYSTRGWLIDGRPIASLPGAFISWLRRRSKDEVTSARMLQERAERDAQRKAREQEAHSGGMVTGAEAYRQWVESRRRADPDFTPLV